MILDEVDKVGGATTNFGDPSAALLEVLDPAQNTHFRDAYVEASFDLSEVLFIATANDVAKIPAPLRDRLEILQAPGYTDAEKVDIVRRVLWGEQLEVNGLAGGFWTRTAAAAHGGAGGGGVRGGGPPAAGRGGARWSVGGHDAVGGRSRVESVQAADGGRGRGDGCGDPRRGAGPHLRGGSPAPRAQARRHLPVRGEPPGGGRR